MGVSKNLDFSKLNSLFQKKNVTIQRDLAFFIAFVETHGRVSQHYTRRLNFAE